MLCPKFWLNCFPPKFAAQFFPPNFRVIYSRPNLPPLFPAQFFPLTSSRRKSSLLAYKNPPPFPCVSVYSLNKMDPPYKNPPHLFNEFMADAFLDSARYVMRESKVETFEEFISSDALLRKVGRKFES